MIKTLSPYYYSVPLVNPNTSIVCNSYTLKVYVWDGIKSAIPSTPDYESTKINASSSNGTDKIDIARLVNDFIVFDCVQSIVTSLEDGNNQVWVKLEVYYDDQPTIAQLETTSLATKGYGYFMEGENPQLPTNKILLEGDEFKVNRNGTFVLPILLNEITVPEPEFIITSITGGDTINYTINFDTVNILLKYRQLGDTLWTESGEVFPNTSPIDYEIPLTGDVEVQIYTYYSLLGEVVYSNIFTITI